jgi:hypothetical protein
MFIYFCKYSDCQNNIRLCTTCQMLVSVTHLQNFLLIKHETTMQSNAMMSTTYSTTCTAMLDYVPVQDRVRIPDEL